MKTIHARQLTLKNIHATAPKNSYKEFDNEKKIPAAQKSPPPYNFSNGPSLIDKISLRDPQCPAFLYHSASASATELEVNGFVIGLLSYNLRLN